MKNTNDNFDVKILLIDDEHDVLEIIKTVMNEYGYQNIETSISIENAKEIFKDKHFDILIIDMKFNGEYRGFELLELGNEQNKLASNMIIFTANDNVMSCRKAFKMGAWDYIPKNLVDDDPYEEIHKSIQEAINHINKWGNDKDNHWVNEHIDELMEEYDGKYVAVMDNKIIASADTKDDLINLMKTSNSPTLMPVIFKVE